LDPRIKRIKQEEKAAREAKKRGKSGSGTSTPVNTKALEEQKKKEQEERKAEEEKVRLDATFESKYQRYLSTG
jgi:DnaJ homolog subfamily C member 2